jgi:hypothetical protein
MFNIFVLKKLMIFILFLGNKIVQNQIIIVFVMYMMLQCLDPKVFHDS